ncbi:MAG TPA: GyrI-like domain-containing protein [Bryobacteraceae bacterium]|nr:GyrI-like domain-containing protein [Bryobacteraceae bacterium]
MDYETVIREVPTIKVAALAHRGGYGQIGATFEQMVVKAARLNLFGLATRFFAIYYDDPSTTAQDALRSDVCVTVPEVWAATEGLEPREIRGGRYAVTLHVGPYAELGRAYRSLYEQWLPQSGETPDRTPLVEAYLNDARLVSARDLRTEIWLPLAG